MLAKLAKGNTSKGPKCPYANTNHYYYYLKCSSF